MEKCEIIEEIISIWKNLDSDGKKLLKEYIKSLSKKE